MANILKGRGRADPAVPFSRRSTSGGSPSSEGHHRRRVAVLGRSPPAPCRASPAHRNHLDLDRRRQQRIAPTTTAAGRQRACACAPLWKRCNRQSRDANRLARYKALGAAVTEALNVPLDRRGTPRTYHLVANTLGVANCQTVAPPARGDMQQGKAAVPEWTAAAQSRASPAALMSACCTRQESQARGMGWFYSRTLRWFISCHRLSRGFVGITPCWRSFSPTYSLAGPSSAGWQRWSGR